MLVSALTIGLLAAGAPKNLLANGDFSRGYRGFTTLYGRVDKVWGDGTYCIVSDTIQAHPGACSFRDHKTGHGKMMVINGSASPGLPFWIETIKVQPNHHYTFTGWAASWSLSIADGKPIDTSPARIALRVNGKHINEPFAVSEKSGNWTKFSYDWDSGKETEAKIWLTDVNQEVQGNDFAIDELSFTESGPQVASLPRN